MTHKQGSTLTDSDHPTALTPAEVGEELGRLRRVAADTGSLDDLDRMQHLRYFTADYDAGARRESLAASINQIDPRHDAGPYLFLGEPGLNVEQLAFEEWRLCRLYAEGEDDDSIPGMLLWVMSPFVDGLTETEKTAHLMTKLGLCRRDITAADFPGFDLVQHMRAHDRDFELITMSTLQNMIENAFGADPGLQEAMVPKSGTLPTLEDS